MNDTTSSVRNAPCPCGGIKGDGTARFAACCGPYLAGNALAPTAEALMRSRYTSYVLKHAAHVARSWHPSTRPTTHAFDESNIKWLGLSVKSHTVIDATHATVHFVARFRDASGRGQRSEELSRFVRENGAWLYVDGDHSGDHIPRKVA